MTKRKDSIETLLFALSDAGCKARVADPVMGGPIVIMEYEQWDARSVAKWINELIALAAAPGETGVGT